MLPRSLTRKFELSRLLPLLGAPCLEVPPACTGPLLRVTARLALVFGLASTVFLCCGPVTHGSWWSSVPHPSGEVVDNHSSTLEALDIDWDDSFRLVLALIRNFRSMVEPAGVPSARCKTSLASIYGLLSETLQHFTCQLPLCCGPFLMTRI